MSTARPLVAFLSDYGLADEFVGVCKSVMLGLAPELTVLDVTHEIPPHDVRAGALALVRSAQYLPEGGLVLAVVDPGVGTERRLVGVEVERATFFGPDNGLLAPAVAMLGGARRVVSLTNTDYHLPAPGATFAGRDILAPAVSHVASGVDLGVLGEEVDAAGLTPGLVSLPQDEPGGAIAGEVWWVDRFGNCQLNIDPEELQAHGASPGDSIEVHYRDERRAARWVATYAEAKPSELVIVTDSYGLTSLALDRQSAAATCKLHAGAAVTLVPPGGGTGAEQAPETGSVGTA